MINDNQDNISQRPSLLTEPAQKQPAEPQTENAGEGSVQRMVRRALKNELSGHIIGAGIFCLFLGLFFFNLPFHNFLVGFFYAIFDRLSYVGGIYQ